MRASLFGHIKGVGWHPFLRINLGGKVRPVGAERFEWLCTLVPQPGSAWCGEVDCFVGRTVRCTLLARLRARLRRRLAGADRSGSPGCRCGLVQHARLDRSGLQRYETWRRALAPNQDDRSGTSESAVVSHCRGDLVGPQRRG